MLPRSRELAVGLALLCTGIVPPVHAASLTAEQMKSAERTDDFSIPTPGEFMAALNKLSPKPDWSSKERPPISTNFTVRAQAALNLGTLVADGYLAVEAESKQSVKNIGKDIKEMAKNLSVEKAITDRGSSLLDFADEGKWDVLREELEATQNEVKAKLADRGDQDLTTLVTVGAWIRGTQLIASHVAKSYTKEGAQLLRQPGIVEFLATKLDAMPDKVRDEPSVKRVRVKLAELRTAVSFPRDAEADKTAIKRIFDLTSELVKDIAKKDLQ